MEGIGNSGGRDLVEKGQDVFVAAQIGQLDGHLSESVGFAKHHNRPTVNHARVVSTALICLCGGYAVGARVANKHAQKLLGWRTDESERIRLAPARTSAVGLFLILTSAALAFSATVA